MAVQQIKGDDYVMGYDQDSNHVSFSGTIRLQSAEDYAPMTVLLQTAHDHAAGKQAVLTLDFGSLQFLNSSGINMISKFVIAARKENRIAMKVLGNKEIYWQQKSLMNLQKLWASVEIQIQ